MKRNILRCWMWVVLLCTFCFADAQSDLKNFKALESQGPVPSDFAKIAVTDKDQRDYNVLLKYLVMNGDILYGTKLNKYLDVIVDNLMKDDPVKRSKVHVYIVKSTSVNAYSTSSGMLFVDMGLLAQVSNESELAFVLGHEIAHYTENHVPQTKDFKDSLKERDRVEYYMKYHTRSRAQELEADRVSIERYLRQSPYSLVVLDGIFDVLQYSDLPFDEVPFDKSLVETDFYQFPENHYLKTVTPISNRADMVDTLFTHPNIERRRTAAQSLVAGIPETGRSVFVQPESLFNEVRDLARLEYLHILLNEHRYDHAFYNAYVLRRVHPDNAFIEQTMVETLYGLSKHKNYGQVSDVTEDYHDVEGEMQQTSYFLSRLSKQESTLLALRAAWKAREKYPENHYYQEVIEDALMDLVVNSKMKYTDFSDYPMGTNPDSITVEETSAPQDSTINKYARIRQQNRPTKVIPTSKFRTMNYMLVDIHQDQEFIDLMHKAVRRSEEESALGVVRRKAKPAESKNLVLATPQYLVYTNRRTSVEKAIDEKRSTQLRKTLQHSARRLGLNMVSYTAKDISSFSTDQYNQYAKLQQFIYEYLQSDGIEMVYAASREMGGVQELTGTSTVCFTAVRRSPANFVTYGKIQNILLSAACPYFFLPAAAEFAFPRYDTDMYMLIVDLASGKTLLTSRDDYESAMSKAYVDAFVYENLYYYVKGDKK